MRSNSLSQEVRAAICEWLLIVIRRIAPNNMDGLYIRNTVQVYFELKHQAETERKFLEERHQRVMQRL